MAVKLGMMPVWTKSGDRHVVTMLQVLNAPALFVYLLFSLAALPRLCCD